MYLHNDWYKKVDARLIYGCLKSVVMGYRAAILVPSLLPASRWYLKICGSRLGPSFVLYGYIFCVPTWQIDDVSIFRQLVYTVK